MVAAKKHIPIVKKRTFHSSHDFSLPIDATKTPPRPHHPHAIPESRNRFFSGARMLTNMLVCRHEGLHAPSERPLYAGRGSMAQAQGY
jgi:hypothetical protein